jgi:Uma2 family endonuclease
MMVAAAADAPDPDDSAAGGPVSRRAFMRWPLRVGRIEAHDGITYVHSAGPEGFTVDDHRRIPAGGRVELLDGVAAVSPTPAPPHQRAVGQLYRALSSACPDSLEPFIGPLGVRIGPATVFEPDVLVLARDEDTTPPALVIEVLSDHGRSYDREVKYRGYQDAGVASYWIVDPDVPSVTVFELDDARGYREAGSYTGDDLCSVDRPFPVRFRPSELI